MTECQLMRIILVPDVTILCCLLKDHKALEELPQDQDVFNAVNDSIKKGGITNKAW
jgi:hypothetical protein